MEQFHNLNLKNKLQWIIFIAMKGNCIQMNMES